MSKRLIDYAGILALVVMLTLVVGGALYISRGNFDDVLNVSDSVGGGAPNSVEVSSHDEFLTSNSPSSTPPRLSLLDKLKDFFGFDVGIAADIDWDKTVVDSGGDVGKYSSYYVDRGGNQHVAYYDTGDLKYAWFNYSSSTWSTETLDSAGDVGQYTSIGVEYDNLDVHIFYYDASNGNLKHAEGKYGDWDLETVISGGDVGQYSSLLIDRGNDIHIAYYNVTGADLGYLLYNGTWYGSTLDTGTDVGQYTDIAEDWANVTYISYYNATGGDLKVAFNNGSWYTQTVDAAGDVGQYTSIVADTNGDMHVSYYNATGGDLLHAFYNGSWYGETIESANDVGQYSSICIDGSHDLHVFYYDVTNGDLRHSNGTNGLWTSEIANGGADDVGQYASCMVDDLDKVHSSFYDVTNGDLKTGVRDYRGWYNEVIDNIGNTGYRPTIFIDQYDNIHVSYYYDTSDDLRYAFYNGTWYYEAVATGGNVGAWNDLTVTSAGTVYIAFGNSTAGELQFAYGSLGSWSVETAAATINPAYLTINLDSNEDIYIVCVNSTSSDLAVAFYNGSWFVKEIVSDHNVFYIDSEIDSNDIVHISYNNNSAGDIYHAYGTYDSWASELASSGDGYYNQMDLDSNDNIYIAYEDNVGDDLEVAFYNGTWYNDYLIGGLTNDYMYLDIAIDSNDEFRISTIDTSETNDHFNYVNGTLNGAVAKLKVDNSTNFGYIPRIELDSVEREFIVVFEFSGVDLEVWTRAPWRYAVGAGDVGDQQDPVITLNAPAGGYSSGNPSIDFNATVTDNIGLSTVKLYVNGSQEAANTSGVNGDYIFPESFSPAYYEWYIYAEDANANSATSATLNFTITALNYTVEYNDDTYPDAVEPFNLTIEYDQVVYPNATVDLTWNGTQYAASLVGSVGNVHTWSKTLTMPSVPNPTSIDLYFNMSETGGENGTATYHQTIYPISIDDCSSHSNIILNVSLWDELNPNTPLNETLEINFDILTIDGGASSQSYSFHSNSDYTHQFCISDATAVVVATVELYYYDNLATYAPRNYYLVNNTLTVTDQLYLYSLNATYSSTFDTTLVDESTRELVGAYIQVLRYYVDEMSYRTVEVAKTDHDGRTVIHMQPEDPYYKFNVIYENELIYTSEPTKAYCASVPCAYYLQVVSSETEYLPFETYPDVVYSLTFNSSGTNLYRFEYTDTSGATTYGRLEVNKRNTTGEYLICNTSQYSAAATIVCDVSAHISNESHTFIGDAYISRSPDKFFDQLLFSIGQNSDGIYNIGDEGVFWAIALIMTLGLTAIWNPTATILMGLFALLMVSIMGFVALPYTSIVAAVVLASILIWRIRS